MSTARSVICYNWRIAGTMDDSDEDDEEGELGCGEIGGPPDSPPSAAGSTGGPAQGASTASLDLVPPALQPSAGLGEGSQGMHVRGKKRNAPVSAELERQAGELR